LQHNSIPLCQHSAVTRLNGKKLITIIAKDRIFVCCTVLHLVAVASALAGLAEAVRSTKSEHDPNISFAERQANSIRLTNESSQIDTR